MYTVSATATITKERIKTMTAIDSRKSKIRFSVGYLRANRSSSSFGEKKEFLERKIGGGGNRNFEKKEKMFPPFFFPQVKLFLHSLPPPCQDRKDLLPQKNYRNSSNLFAGFEQRFS
jgi:hypothetical protein